MAIIECLLIPIYTGRAPTKRTFEMICLYMSGWASLEELERHIEKLRLAKKQAPARLCVPGCSLLRALKNHAPPVPLIGTPGLANQPGSRHNPQACKRRAEHYWLCPLFIVSRRRFELPI